MGVKQTDGLMTKIVRRNAMHMIAFGFAAGRMKCPGTTFAQSIEEFVHHFGLKETNTESLEREVRRMIVEYLREGL